VKKIVKYKFDELRIMLMGLRRFTKHEELNITKCKREIADNIIKSGSYNL